LAIFNGIIYPAVMRYGIAFLLFLFSLNHGCAQWTQSQGLWGADIRSILTTDSTFLITSYGNNLHLCRLNQPEWEEKDASGDDLFKIGDVLFSQNFNHIFRSFDDGDSWHELPVMPWVYMRATDSVLFRSDYGLYRSFDYGDTWEDISENAGIQDDDDFVIETWNDVVLINLQYDDLYLVSYDEGESWMTLPTEGLPIESYFFIFKFCLRENEIWISTTDGIFRLPDNEYEWLPVDTATIHSDAYFYEYHDTLFIGSTKGCHYFNEEDSVWAELNDGLKYPDVSSFATWHDTLYCSSYPGIYKMNAEGNWDLWNSELSFIRATRLYSHNNDVWVRTTTPETYFRSSDNGENFHEIDPGLVGVADAMIMTDSIYYLCCQDGFYISLNRGGSWIQCNNGLETLMLSSIAINAQHCYAGTPLGLYRTSNPPETWEPVPNYLGNHAVHNLAVNDSIIICTAKIGEDSYSMMRSEDSGDNFQYFCVNGNCDTNFSMRYTAPNFFSLSLSSSYYSIEDSQEWNNIPLPEQYRYNSSFSTGENCLMIAGGLYEYFIRITYNLGLEWIDISDGLPPPPGSNSPIEAHTLNNQRIFIGVQYKGLWYRDDLLTHTEEPENTSTGGMEVWPNPFTNEVNIKFHNPEIEISQVCIFDLQGRLLHHEKIMNDAHATIYPKNCKKDGLYILQVFTSDQSYSAKLLLK
jgi:hypothetical protein